LIKNLKLKIKNCISIGIDGNEANLKTRVGVGQYAYNLLRQLYLLDTKNNYHIYLKDKPLKDLPKPRKNWHYVVIGPKAFWTKIALPLHLVITNVKLDYFYSPGHYSPSPAPLPTIPTIHDIGYLQYPTQFTKKDFYQLVNWTQRSIKQATHIIAVSEFTKSELINTYHLKPENISVVYNGTETPPKITSNDTKKVLSKFKINKAFFLAVGILKPNKNYPFLIKAFSEFLKHQKTKGQSYQLVIAGKKGWLFSDIEKIMSENSLASEVIFTDYISETEKWALYQNAEALVIPSTYEGFGIPAIESQKVGTPVIASHIPPLKEVLETSALFINPYKINTLIEAFEKILDRKLRAKLIFEGKKQSRKFTWKLSAKKLISIFNHLN